MGSHPKQTATATHGMFYLKPAPWHWGRSLRAALCVGLPFACGIYLNDIMPWMWIAMGTLMMTTGERQVAYLPRCTGLLGTATLGAAGYLLGYLHLLPYGYTLAAMACAGYAASLLSRRGPNWSIACLQFLLTAAIAIGVPAIATFWQPAAWYLLGALIYVAVLGVEAIAVRLLQRAARPASAPTHAPTSVHTRSPASPPALALALCLVTAYASKYLIPESHWFWVPLTVGLIMKPDLGNIFDRSILRCLGTALGVLIASAILDFFPKDVWMALFIAALAGVLPWCMARSYALQAVSLTPLVLLLVDTIVPGAHNTNESLQRLSDTIIGAAIAIVLGYVLWSHPSKGTKRPA